MSNRIFCASILLFSSFFCVAQTSSGSQSPEMPKEIPSFDLTAMDKAADPCVDFYQYACGSWTKSNPIPADKSRWGRFNELGEHNLYVLHDILEEASGRSSNGKPSGAGQKTAIA